MFKSVGCKEFFNPGPASIRIWTRDLPLIIGFTGQAPNPEDLRALEGLPVIRLVGSGVQPGNIDAYHHLADVFIVGSWFKKQGHWANPPQKERVDEMLSVFSRLNEKQG